MTGDAYERRDKEAFQFALTTRAPTLSLMSIFRDCRTDTNPYGAISQQLRKNLDIINRQVVVLQEFGEICRELSTPGTVKVIESTRSKTVLVAAGPYIADLGQLRKSLPTDQLEYAPMPPRRG